MTAYQRAFIDRFKKNIIDLADSTDQHSALSDALSADLKKLSNLERELYDQHRRSRQQFVLYKSRMENRQVDINYDMMEDDMKKINKRMRR